MAEQISLVKKSQKKFSKNVAKVKKQIQTGEVTVRQTPLRTPRRPERGVVYLSHIPHGFYEEQMREYFKQFGKVTNVLLCRSKKSGRSRGFGFIEFEFPEVAKIAAETMHNYLMFQRRLIAEYVPPEKQKKYGFKRKQFDLERIPGVLQRRRELFKKNKNDSPMKELKKSTDKMTKLQKKLKKLEKLGIKHEIKPVDVPGALV